MGKERNPYHRPAGTSRGGEFTTGQFEAAVNKGAGLPSNLLPNGRVKPAPRGLYEGEYIPVIDSLSYNVARETLALNAQKGIETYSKMSALRGKIVKIQVVGSFLSSKEEPKDLDLLIEFADKQSLIYFLREAQPARRYSFGRVEFMGWTKKMSGIEEVANEYILKTKKLYDVDPVDITEWLK